MFRFTIRDMLWLTVVVGLVLCWADNYWRYRSISEELAQQRAERRQLESGFAAELDKVIAERREAEGRVQDERRMRLQERRAAQQRAANGDP